MGTARTSAVNGTGKGRIGATALANVLGLSRQRVAELARSGLLQRDGRGKYDLSESVRRYVEHHRKRTAGTTARGTTADLVAARVVKEQALGRLRSLEARQRAGELVDVEAVSACVFEAAREARDQWQAAPARWAPDLAARWGIDAREVRHGLEDMVRAMLDATPPLDVVRRLKARGVRLEDDAGTDEATAAG